jgi:hypothetical protein
MSRNGTPAMSPAVQNVRRRECGLTAVLSPAALA